MKRDEIETMVNVRMNKVKIIGCKIVIDVDTPKKYKKLLMLA
ncbi:MAG: hypothetical protein ACI8WT_004006 [Clostridium sp.]|jgi:hypothetical protein